MINSLLKALMEFQMYSANMHVKTALGKIPLLLHLKPCVCGQKQCVGIATFNNKVLLRTCFKKIISVHLLRGWSSVQSKSLLSENVSSYFNFFKTTNSTHASVGNPRGFQPQALQNVYVFVFVHHCSASTTRRKKQLSRIRRFHGQQQVQTKIAHKLYLLS